MDNSDHENVTENLDPRIGISKNIAKFGLVFSIILSVLAIGSIISAPDSNSENVSSESNVGNVPDVSWAPPGFTVWPDDSNVAYRWTEKSNCDNYGCVQAEFMSKNGCPSSFYAAVNWLDSGNSVISYDNATLPSLKSMQVAKLRFDDVEGSSKSAQMAEINCR
jgi:hypothetical protein